MAKNARLTPEEMQEKRQQIQEIIDRCGRLSDTDLAEIFGGVDYEDQYTLCTAIGEIS